MKIGFERHLVVMKTGPRTWRVNDPLVYRSKVLAAFNPIIVPAGFETDFASVWRPLWSLFPPDGSYTPAAVVHDWLYRKTVMPLCLCDEVFLEAMKACGTGFWTRHIMWLAVRLFGWLARKRKG